MSNKRAGIFDDMPSLDVTGFEPKSVVDTQAPPADEVKAVAEAAHFRSREAPPAKVAKPPKKARRVHRTGRNAQFNIKALQKSVDDFYGITAEQGWVLGYTLERAVEALKRELKKSS